MAANYPFIYADELATKARAILRERRLRALPVLDANKRVVGMISRSDVMAISSSVSAIRVNGIMSAIPWVATPDIEVIEALREMLRVDQWYVPVARSSQDPTYVGVFALEHFILKALEREVARLNLPISKFMATRLVTCSTDDETDNVWKKMKKRSLAACPVTNRGALVGIVAQQDMLESGAMFPTFEDQKGRFKSPTKISAVMKTPAVSLKPTDTLKDAALLMLERNIGRLPIVDDRDKLVGIVDREDIVRALINNERRKKRVR
jgi:CBS domain-containing protein